jgi:hypothetical protein
MITFPFPVPQFGEVRIERPADDEIIYRSVKPGDVFVVSPDGILHHNHDEVCPFHGVSDVITYTPERQS